MLSERSREMVLDGQASDPVPVLSDVPQGSVIGPFFYQLSSVQKISGHPFAFLLTIVFCLGIFIKSPMYCQILPDDLNNLVQWETAWQMKFNVAKCHSIWTFVTYISRTNKTISM